MFFFFNDTATTEIYTLSLHDALPICWSGHIEAASHMPRVEGPTTKNTQLCTGVMWGGKRQGEKKKDWQKLLDRKSTRLNSSHANISYAVFCLKKKKNTLSHIIPTSIL